MAYISKITPLGSTTTYDLSALKVRSFSTIGSSSTDHATALKNFFDNNKTNTPRNELIHFYDGSQGNGSASFGYFLSGYDTAPYGGFFVAHYNNPYYIGIQSGSYVQQHLLTSTNYTSYTVKKDGTGATGTWGISITGNAATATSAGKITTAGTTAQFWRGDNSWSNTLSGGTLKITNNSNTLEIGSANTSWAHFTNSANIPFYFNHQINAVDGFKIYNTTTSLTNNNLTFSQGGGWSMSDSTWIRTVGGKSVYMNTGTFRNDGTTQLRTLQHVNANIATDGSWTTGATGTANSGDDNATQGTQGTSILTIGNNIARPAAGTAGGANNSQGYLRLHSSGTGYGELTGYTTSANTHIHATNGFSAPENRIGFMFRPGSGSYYTHISYETSGNEALVAATQNAVTSFIFVNGESYANVAADRWTKLTGASGAGNAPGLQIKQNCVSIGELIPSGTNATYKLNVNGTQRIKSGSLQIYPTGGNYNDGIRIHARSTDNTWAAITLCGADNTGDTGISANSWFLGNNSGNLYITRNGSSNGTAMLACVNNVWQWNGTATGSISGNAGTATALTSNAGSTTQPVYFSGGKPVAATAYSGLLTAFSSSTNTLSITVGGTTKTATTVNSVSNAWTDGTTAGPTIKTTVNGVAGTAVAIPTATASASGVVTTGAQSFAGGKTFKYTTRIYPQIGTTSERSQWYKITFPYYNAETTSSAKWFMNSFDLHFGGGYSSNASGVAHISFYWTRAANNGAWSATQVSAMITGIYSNKINLYYRIAEPGILYVNNTSNNYNGIWLDNLYVDDTSPSLDWSTITIATCAAITSSTSPALSDYTIVPATKLYTENGTTLKTNVNFEGQYIKGTWLYTSAATAKTTTSKIATIESDNYIYYITPQNLRNTMGLGNTTGALPTANGGTGNTSFTANRLVYSESATKLSSATSLYATSTALSINKTSITSGYNFEVVGNTRQQGDLLITPSQDATLKIYDTTNTTYGNETIAIQSCFDNQDPESSTYTSSYENRCNLLLQPRGGQVYISDNITGVGNTNYSLLVNGRTRLNNTTASSTTNETGQLVVSNTNGGHVALELWRGDNASWQLANESGVLYLRNNYTTAKQTTYSQTSLAMDYNTGNTAIAGSLSVGQTTRNTSYKLYINGTSYFNGNTTHNGVDYFANGTSYYINNSGSANLLDITGRSLGVAQTDGTGCGISLYGGAKGTTKPEYGFSFAKTTATNYQKFGDVSSDWATYFHMNASANNRGWIFQIGNTATASISGRGHFTGSLTPSSWIDGQRYTTAAYNIADYSNTGSYNPWMRATNTYSSGTDSAKVGRWFSFGTLGPSFIWGGSQTTRTANSFENKMEYNVSNGQLTVSQVNGNASTATKLANARTISLTGSITGSASFDGSGNISIATTTNHTHSDYIPKSIGTTKGDIIYWSAGSTPARLGIGSNGKVLKVVSGVPAWGDVSIPYGETLPSTGTNGDVFLQTSAEYYELPAGGTTGQVLAKSSNADRAVQWVSSINISPSSAKFYPAGSTVATTNSNPQVFNTAIYVENNVLFGAAWNDYAEFRKDNPIEKQEPGRCVRELGDGTLALTTQRLERGCEIISNTFGFAIGQDEKNGYNTPIASSGRVLAYPYESIEEFSKHIGWPVCSGPNGTVSIMTEEEEEKYSSRIIGTISEIPTYKEWGASKVQVNGRIWIKIK